MIFKKTIKNRDVYASAIEASVFDQDAEGYVTGQFAGSYKLDKPPGPMIAGTFVKGANGKTCLFQNAAAAVDAAFDAAEAALP